MSFRVFLLVIVAATLLAWGAWIYVMTQTDPTVSGAAGFALFYLTLFVSLVGTFSVIGTLLRSLLARREVASRQVTRSLRQGIWLAALVVGSLALLAANVFSALTVSILVFFFALIELAFLSTRPRHPPSA